MVSPPACLGKTRVNILLLIAWVIHYLSVLQPIVRVESSEEISHDNLYKVCSLNLKSIHPTSMKLFVHIEFIIKWNILHVPPKLKKTVFEIWTIEN